MARTPYTPASRRAFVTSVGAAPVSHQLPDSIPGHALYDALLTRHQVVVKVVPGNWFNGRRISTQLFNTADDVDALLMALRRELA